MNEIQKDLVLSINEYAYVLDRTKGNVSCWVGPAKTSLSTSDELVCFNSETKKFESCNRYSDAISLFATAPENWYIALKNPAADGRHPTCGTANSNPEKMDIGRKVNIPGPVSFALYPGQMAKVIKGHSLRSNQYLLARVYDAESLTNTEENYVNGQIFIIKGTDMSFYIPPTGVEVIPVNNDDKMGYVRDAVTLERLEYCILKDEDGNKRYVHGPEVVFPEPTESFIYDKNNQIKYRAIELSEISGVYVKVIADYKENDITHKTGEELFITGKEQMIYYPRPEHSFITYNDQIRHHAIAIPKGQGRYIMNRITGEIKTVTGPAMYLPDPRIEVVVRRTLSRSECELMYPGNKEVLKANGYDDTMVFSDWAPQTTFATATSSLNNLSKSITALSNIPRTEAVNINKLSESDGSGIARQNKFTPPRTISLADSKYEGAVSVDVWTGYAVNIISKDGNRKVVRGPQTILLDYDQTLEMLELSTGKPKTTDRLDRTVFLKYENNRISDVIEVETADFVKSQVKVSYLVSFDNGFIDKWFAVDNYIKHLCDWAKAIIKKNVRTTDINNFCNNYHDIVKNSFKEKGKENNYIHIFNENGMKLMDVEVLSINIESDIQEMIDEHQKNIVANTLDLSAAQQSAAIDQNIYALNQEKVALKAKYEQFKMEQEHQSEMRNLELKAIEQKALNEETKRRQTIEQEIQILKNAVFEAEQIRLAKQHEEELAFKKALAEIESKKEADAADSMVKILTAIGPELAAAMNAENNSDIIKAIAEAVSPYALAKGESVADATNKLLRGTSIEELFHKKVN